VLSTGRLLAVAPARAAWARMVLLGSCHARRRNVTLRAGRRRSALSLRPRL